MSSRKDFTTGSILRHILPLAVLTGVYQLLESGYYLADLYWVSGLGEHATAAVTMAGQLQVISMGLALTVMVGATPIVAQAAGARVEGALRPLFNQTLLLAVTIAAVFVFAAYAALPFYFGWFGADAETGELGRDFLVWVIPAFGLKLAAMSMVGPLRAFGDMIRPAIANAVALVLNVVLDPILILGVGPLPPLGVTGAGIATLIAAAAGLAIMVWQYEVARRKLEPVSGAWRPSLAVWGRTLRIGLPVGANAAIDMTSMLVLYWAIRDLGTSAQAGVGVALKVIAGVTVPVYAIAFSIAPLVGQSVGNQDRERVRATFHVTSLATGGLMLLIALFLQVDAELLARPFSSDHETVEQAARYLMVVAWALPSMAILNNALGVFEGLGNTIKPILTDLLRLATFAAIVLVIARRPDATVTTVAYATLLSYVGQTVLLPYLLYRDIRRSQT